ncbi:neuroendocrine convertase 1-like isoform X2 [Stegodyphus dumicola]|uniref:neuroendocrine convertase 1-like isoform X2 n=1 Tax=Stegodyphus dumicola TaxID=202533 RepID=UPI0015ADF917|nr:neuroendocrine convertase 1-like isoform X2 [Stegodyphus dumicola]
MEKKHYLAFIFSICAILCGFTAAHDGDGHFMNDWVVRLTGGKEVVDQLVIELGYLNLGELKGFPNTYLMRKIDHPQRSRRNALHLTKRLSEDSRVEWAEQQIAKRRVKREFLSGVTANFLQKTTRENNRFNDYLWPDQWYLHDTRNLEDLPELDMRTIPVWNMGYTGKGIVVSIMDDGLEWNHTDIRRNYDPKASWDTNDNDPDPFPRYDESDSNNHGTRCAGEVSMTANNEKCGVGVAYNSKIGGIRMLDGIVNDAVESVSLAHSIDHIDIFSASWGPNDDGMTVDGPKRLAVEALEKGIQQGRSGKGVIYVWASGNGGSKGDNCNCDGYTNSIYTLSVGSASQRGDFPWYGERCASTMTTAYSSGAYSDQKIATTDLHNKCTVHHTGTSAAAPLAAGVIALVLEAKLPQAISSKGKNEVVIDLTTNGCLRTPGEINYLEHVEVTLDIDYNHRGALDIYLFSPSGTVSMILSRRERDSSAIGFKNWTFLSVHFWGENPAGQWKVLVRDLTGKNYKGSVNFVKIALHGTKQRPQHMAGGLKRYVDQDVMERILDKTPEFEEEAPKPKDSIHDELENLRSVEHKKKLSWEDLVGKHLRNLSPHIYKFNRIEYPDIILEEDDVDYIPFHDRFTY